MGRCDLHWPDGYESVCASCHRPFDEPAAPSLAAGAIARGLSDAAEAYRRRTLTYLLEQPGEQVGEQPRAAG